VPRLLTDQEDLVNPIRRSAAIALVSGVAVASLAVPSAGAPRTAAAVTTTRSPAAAAAGYLARRLTGKHHDHYVDVVGKAKFADDGETADAVLSMDAAGVAQTAARRAARWLAKDAKNYLTGGGFTTAYYPGSLGKLLLVATAQHLNPRHFGGIDLVAALVASEGAGTGTAPGQYQNANDTTFGSSVITQSLAMLALAGTSTINAPDPAATAFLAGQACPDGGFQVGIRTAGGCSSEDVDATAYATQALVASNAKAKVRSAINWLRAHENSNGGWSEQPGSGSPSDANSTAIAVEALIAAHRKAGPGIRWLRRHQEGCGAKASRRGAVLFQSGKFDPATALRATSQAGAALALRPLNWIDRTGASGPAPVLRCPAAHRS
jgi:hypothetical protein